MDIKLERAIIRTFRKLREIYDEDGQPIPTKVMSVNEICGLFVNFCYAEYGVHTGLNTTYINMMGSSMGWKIWFNDQRQYYRTEFSNLIEKALSEVEEYEFYSMWLRSSWESPKDDTWAHPVVREALKNYKGYTSDSNVSREAQEIESQRKYIAVTDEVDKASIDRIAERIQEVYVKYPTARENPAIDYTDGYYHCYNNPQYWRDSYKAGRITKNNLDLYLKVLGEGKKIWDGGDIRPQPIHR